MNQEFVNVKEGNEYLIFQFAQNMYGSPFSWGWGKGLIVRSYPGFEIESKKEFFDDKYSTKIKFFSQSNKSIKNTLIYLATAQDISFSESFHKVNELADKIGNDFLFKLNRSNLA